MDKGARNGRLWGQGSCTEWITELNGCKSGGKKHGLFGLGLEPQVRKLGPKAQCMCSVEKWQSPRRTGLTHEQAWGADGASSGTCLIFRPLLLDLQFGFVKILPLCLPLAKPPSSHPVRSDCSKDPWRIQELQWVAAPGFLIALMQTSATVLTQLG